MEKEQLVVGMVVVSDDEPGLEYVIIRLSKDVVTLERITKRNQSNNIHSLGYGWFKDYYKKKRIMGKKELSMYQSKDPFCNCVAGIYLSKVELVNIHFHTLARAKEIIKVEKVKCKKLIGSGRHELKVTYLRFGYQDEFEFLEVLESKGKCYHRFWELFELQNLSGE